jgi:hypothetical protein
VEHWYSWAWSKPTKDVFGDFAPDVTRLLQASGMTFVSASYDEASTPEITSTRVAFAPDQTPPQWSGVPDIDFVESDSAGTAFVLGEHEESGRCEAFTDEYNTVIMSILVRACVHLPDFHVWSSAEWETDWTPGRERADAVFGSSPPAISLNESDLEEPATPAWVKWRENDGLDPEVAAIMPIDIAKRSADFDYEAESETWTATISGLTTLHEEDVTERFRMRLQHMGFAVDVHARPHPLHGYTLTTVDARRENERVEVTIVDYKSAAKQLPYAYRKLTGATVVSVTHAQSLSVG